MKPDQAKHYESRLIRVLSYIETNLDQPLQLEDLARVAHFSPFHFHRIFKGMTGETLGGYIRRTRLEQAALRLENDKAASITFLALDVGFENSESFSRAFKAYFGISPSHYQQSGKAMITPQALRSAQRLTSQRMPGALPPLLKKETYAMSFTIEIKTEPETTIAYMPHKGPYNEIGGVMQQVLQQASQQGLMNEESRMLGLSYDDPDQVAPQDLRSDAAVIIAAGQKAQAPLQTKTIPAGDFAAVQYKGPYDGLKSAYNWMFGQWLPSSGRDIADYPCIEVYLNDPQSCEPKDYLTEIRIPLR